MARIRTIKPQFWLDEKLGSIDRSARLLYIGLWNLCDDQGVFEWRPARIKAQLFPYDKDVNGGAIDKWLDLLVATGDIVRFTENGGDFGHIPTFLKHQEIKKPSKWVFATPPEPNSTPPVPHQLPTSALVVGEQGFPPQNILAKPGDATTNRARFISPPVGSREKEKEKEKESITPKKPYGEFLNVLLADGDYQKLLTQFGELGAKERIERLSSGIASKGYKYKSHYATILSWERRDGGNNGRPGKHQEVPGNRPRGAFADIEENNP